LFLELFQVKVVHLVAALHLASFSFHFGNFLGGVYNFALNLRFKPPLLLLQSLRIVQLVREYNDLLACNVLVLFFEGLVELLDPSLRALGHGLSFTVIVVDLLGGTLQLLNVNEFVQLAFEGLEVVVFVEAKLILQFAPLFLLVVGPALGVVVFVAALLLREEIDHLLLLVAGDEKGLLLV